MRGLKAILKRELKAYFNAPIAYVFAVVFLLVTNGIFMTTFFLAGLCDMRGFFQSLPLYLVVFIPALTMRLWAEERKSGTLALLYSFPVSEAAVVGGKFLAAFLFTLLTLASTVVIPIMLAYLGEPDPGPILGGYLGACLVSAFLLALGMAVSAFFQDQIVAFIMSLLAGVVALLLGTDLVSSSLDSWLPGVGSFLREAFGLLVHYGNFAKGVLSLGDVVFFLLFTLIFLLINVFTLRDFLRYRHRPTFFLGTCLLLGIGLFVNATLANLRLPRLDLTTNKLYTVSPAVKKVLARLEVPIQVTYYVSPRNQLPTPMKNIARDVTDLLAEFAALSPKFTYKVVDPTRDPELMDKLREQGITPFAVQTIEKDQVSVRRIYSALAISYLDKKTEVIPQIVPQSLSTLEYDLISRIFKLTLKKSPVVALVSKPSSSSPFLPQADPYQLVRELLQGDGFEVKKIPLTANVGIPKEARLLLVLDPGALNPRQLYEIERFLHQGHPVIIAAQGYTYSYGPAPQGGIAATPIKNDLSINKWLKAYGVTIDDHLLLDEQSAVLAVSSERQMGMFVAVVRTPVRFPMQIKVLHSQMNPNLSVTSNLSALLYLWGSALNLDQGLWARVGLKGEVLFHSSTHSWLRPYAPGPFLPEDLRPGPKDKLGSYPLAVLLSGKFPWSFKHIPPWPGTKAKGKDKDSSQPLPPTKRSHLVVVGCNSMFNNSALQAYANASFLVNLVESLTLGDALLYIRAKTQVMRYLPELSPGQKLFWRILVTALPPAIWVCVGIVWGFYRRRRRERFLVRGTK